MYGTETIDGQGVQFGFADVSDWLSSIILSFPAPWSIAPLDGKYYGTEVMDARGVVIWTCWIHDDKASARLIAQFAEEDDPADVLREYCCDCHHETQVSFDTAARFVSLRNSNKKNRPGDHSELISLLMLGRWEESVWPDISCGGPERRKLYSSSERMAHG